MQSAAWVKTDGKLVRVNANLGRLVVIPDMVKSANIIIPMAAQKREMATTGVIQSIGAPTGLPLPFGVGDKVVFSRYSGIGVTITNKKGDETMALVIAYEDVVCQIEEKVDEKH